MNPRTRGGFSSHVVANYPWVFPIPDHVDSNEWATLLDAGITVWDPLMHFRVKASDKVGIIGIGGLGHIALQFASALGCNLVAISTTAGKQKEAIQFGARDFLLSSDTKAMGAAERTFDFLLSTVASSKVDWNPYLKLLKPDGVLCNVGIPTKMEFAPWSIVHERRKISGSWRSSSKETAAMLRFCEKHNIKAIVEVLPMTAENVDKAMEKVQQNKARYRMVLTNKQDAPASFTKS